MQIEMLGARRTEQFKKIQDTVVRGEYDAARATGLCNNDISWIATTFLVDGAAYQV